MKREIYWKCRKIIKTIKPVKKIGPQKGQRQLDTPNSVMISPFKKDKTLLKNDLLLLFRYAAN